MDEKLENGMTRVWAIWNYVEAIILVAAGVLACVFCNNEGLQGIFSYAIGGFAILDGVLRFLMIVFNYKKSQENMMLISAFEITIGIVIIMLEAQNKGFFVGMAIQFVSIFLISLGGLFLTYSIILIACKRVVKLTMPILEIIFAAILIGLGIFVLVAYYKDETVMKAVVMISMGIIIAIIGGAIAVITTINLLKKKKSAQVNDAPLGKKGSVVEVKAEEKPVAAEPVEPDVIDASSEEPKALEHKEDSEAE